MLFAHCSWAGFTEDQFTIFDGIARKNLSTLQDDATHEIDVLREAMRGAIETSAYSKNEYVVATRGSLDAEGARLKESVAKSAEDIAATISGGRDPAKMIILLAKEERQFIALYQWYRSVIELTNLAWSVGKNDPETNKTLGLLQKSHEEFLALAAESVQAIATRCLGNSN